MTRDPQPEAMEDPGLEPARHDRALRGLTRLNLLSGSARLFWPPIRDLSREEGRPLRVLDLASGAGDVPLGLWRRARRAGLEIEVRGVDASPRAVRFAGEEAKRRGAPVGFEVLDVLADPLPGGFDVLTCSLFLHHLSDEQAVRLLSAMRRAARRVVLIQDLLRSRRGWLLAHAAARLFTRSDVVHADAPQSVRASYTARELRRLAGLAAMEGATISRRWPLRLLLTWETV